MKWNSILLLGLSLGLSSAVAQQAPGFVTGQAARLVIGQHPFGHEYPDTNEWVTGGLSGIAYANGTLLVADDNRVNSTPKNNRVLIYRNLPEVVFNQRMEFPQNGGDRCPACVGIADNVIGQPDLTTRNTKYPPPEDGTEPDDDFVPLVPAQNTLQTPVGVATNGRYVAVADTDNNRVLVWRSIPTSNQQPADFVVGQKDFTSIRGPRNMTADSLRGPQGVWLDDNDGLWVADTINNRVLYYGPITGNGQSAILVLGQANFTTDDQGNIAQLPTVRADTMLNPMSVTSDGTRLFVSDLGLSRVLIWNSIPRSNRQPADVVVGQPDMTTYRINNVEPLCEPTGKDEEDKDIYPARCAATLSMPRFALSAGGRLFIADSGNDRVLVYDQIPTENGKRADVILGQQTELLNQSSDSAYPDRVASTDSFRTPHALAWDGLNLYVSDTYNRRVLLYTPADFHLPLSSVRNAASPFVYAQGTMTVTGTPVKDDELTLKIGRPANDQGREEISNEYKVTVAEDWGLNDIVNAFVEAINTANDGNGDPLVTATPNFVTAEVIFTAKDADELGNEVTLEQSNSNASSTLGLTLSGATLSGGQDPARVAPFAHVAILGENMVEQTSEVQSLSTPLPFELANTKVYFDGKEAPLVFVSPNRIVAQLPVEFTGSTTASGIIRTVTSDGSVRVSTPVAVRVIEQNPSIYNDVQVQPSPGLVYHYSSAATGTISVDGVAKEGDKLTIIIDGREYTYTVQKGDANSDGEEEEGEGETLIQIRDALVSLINEWDPAVEAYPSGFYSRVRLRARTPGPEGNGITLAVRSEDAGGAADAAGAQLFTTNSVMCCANEAGALVTEDNPAVPGETIVVLATGLGVVGPEDARANMVDGLPYNGPEFNDVVQFVDSLAGGKTANVLFSGLRRGTVGIYEVHLELNADIPTNPLTPLRIAQGAQVSNIIAVPVVNPAAAAATTP